MKTLIALAIAAAVLASSGCCLPLHGGRRYHDDGWSSGSHRSESPRPPPSHRDRHGERR